MLLSNSYSSGSTPFYVNYNPGYSMSSNPYGSMIGGNPYSGIINGTGTTESSSNQSTGLVGQDRLDYINSIKYNAPSTIYAPVSQPNTFNTSQSAFVRPGDGNSGESVTYANAPEREYVSPLSDDFHALSDIGIKNNMIDTGLTYGAGALQRAGTLWGVGQAVGVDIASGSLIEAGLGGPAGFTQFFGNLAGDAIGVERDAIANAAFTGLAGLVAGPVGTMVGGLVAPFAVDGVKDLFGVRTYEAVRDGYEDAYDYGTGRRAGTTIAGLATSGESSTDTELAKQYGYLYDPMAIAYGVHDMNIRSNLTPEQSANIVSHLAGQTLTAEDLSNYAEGSMPHADMQMEMAKAQYAYDRGEDNKSLFSTIKDSIFGQSDEEEAEERMAYAINEVFMRTEPTEDRMSDPDYVSPEVEGMTAVERALAELQADVTNKPTNGYEIATAVTPEVTTINEDEQRAKVEAQAEERTAQREAEAAAKAEAEAKAKAEAEASKNATASSGVSPWTGGSGNVNSSGTGWSGTGWGAQGTVSGGGNGGFGGFGSSGGMGTSQGGSDNGEGNSSGFGR